MSRPAIFGPEGSARFDLNTLDRPPDGRLVLIKPNNQIGWVTDQGPTTSRVETSRHEYFGNTMPIDGTMRMPNERFVLIGDSYTCMQDLRNEATVDGVFYDKMPVFIPACRMEITDGKLIQWLVATVYVDTLEPVKTSEGIRINAAFVTTGLDGEPVLNQFLLDPVDVLCASPFWNPHVAADTRRSDQRILHASLFFANASAATASQQADIFERYWRSVKQVEKAKARVKEEDYELVESVVTKGVSHKYKALMGDSATILRRNMITETQGPTSQPYADQRIMPCTGPPIPNGAPRELGWFTLGWIQGIKAYNVQHKREFQDLADMLLALTRSFDLSMAEARHVVSTEMLTNGDMNEFTRKMKGAYLQAQQDVRADRRNTDSHRKKVGALLAECAQRMIPTNVVPVVIAGDPLFEKRTPTGIPDYYVKK